MNASRAKKLLLLACLLAVAALLRIPGDTGAGHYFVPELYRDLNDVRQIAEGKPMLIGPPQFLDTRFHFGPASDYLMLPLAWVTGFRSWSLALSSLMFSLASICLGLYACQRWFRDRTVTVAYAVIAAFSSLDMQFAKYGSSPNFVPFFVILFFIALEPFLRRQARWHHAALLGFSFAVASQLHPVAGVSLGLLLGAAWCLGSFRPRMVHCAVIAAAFLAPYSTYIFYEATHGFENLAGLLSLATGHRDYGNLATRFLESAAFWISLWFNVHHMFGLPYLVGMASLFWLYGTLAVIAGIVLWNKRRPSREHPAVRVDGHVFLMLILWAAIPSALLLIPFGRIKQLPIYYFISMLPLAHMLMALGYRKMKQARLSLAANVTFALFLLWQIGQIALYHAHFPSMLTSILL